MRTRGWSAGLVIDFVTGLVFWGAPLLGGTADRPYTLLCAALCACAAIAALRATPSANRLSASWFHLFFAVAIVATLLQAVPLPPALRALLAPGSDEDLRQLTSGIAPARRFFALSVDVGATLHEAARLLGYLCLLIALTARLTSERRQRKLTQHIFGAAVLVALLGVLAGLGVALPAPVAVDGDGATRALFAAGLHNSNHLAALMGLGALLLLEAARATRVSDADLAGRLRRAGLYGLCGLCNLVLLGTLSRAGIVVWLGVQGLWLLTQGQYGRRDRRNGLLVLGLGALGCLALVALWPTALAALRLRFSAASLSQITAPGGKVYAWLEAWPLLRGHLPLGVGRGAFESAFQHVQGLSGRLRFAYLENEWLQVVVDWGLLGAGALFTLLFLGLGDALRAARQADGRTLRRVALFGLGGLAVHNLFDFNLEIGGLAVAAVGLLALGQQPRPSFALPRWTASVPAVMTLALVALVAARFPSHDEDGARLRALCERPDVSTEEVLSRGQQAALRHPFDAYLPALVAARLHADVRLEPRAAAMRWVNRALLADPREILARQIGAQILVENGHREQGLLLLRGAITDADAQQRRALLRTLRDLRADLDETLSTLPDAPARADFLDLLGAESPPPWPLLRDLAERLVTTANVDRTHTVTWLGRAALALRDVRAAEAAARLLLEDAAYAPALLFADLADLLGDSDKGPTAAGLLRQALLRGDRAELLLSLARLSERDGAVDEARELLDRGLRRAEEPALIARLHEVYGDLEARAGNTFQATHHRREAARLRSRP